MRLADALRIRRGDVIAFVGAGGKSSAIRILAKELSRQLPVVMTTTTKINLDQADLAQAHLVQKSQQDHESIIELLRRFDSVLVTHGTDVDESKWLGLNLEEVQGLANIVKQEGAVLLVEADGARGRSLKAPSAYEPVLPRECDLVVPVVGLDVIGEKIPSPMVHRQELLRGLLGLVDGEQLSIEHIIHLLRSQQGALKGIPSSSTIRVLLNKADSAVDLENGREIGVELIKDPGVQSVLLASVLDNDPVHESIGRVAGIVLAAGSSSRIEGLKQLIPFRGKPMVVHAIDAALGAGLDPIVVVTGTKTGQMEKVLEGLPIHVVENPQPEQGQSSSIRLGMKAIRDRAEAVIFLLADMPLVSSDLVRALIRKHRQTLAAVIVPIAEGQRGNPVLFDLRTFDDLQRLEGDRGGRAIFQHYSIEHIEWDDSIHCDVDSAEDLSKLRELE